MTTEATSYLGEMMVHRGSGKTGPIVRAAKAGHGIPLELTLKTYDGLSFKGAPAEFKWATSEEYQTFVEGFLSDVPVMSY